VKRNSASINGIHISYVDSIVGSKTIVIFHGFLFSAHLYLCLAQQLIDKGFRVIIPDLPGHGQSEPMDPNISLTDMADHMFELIETLVGSEQKVTIIGHSMGGLVCFYFAQRHAKRINRLVLLNSSGLAYINRNVFGWLFAAATKTVTGYKTPVTVLKIFYEVAKNVLQHPQYLLRTAHVVINTLVWPENLLCQVSVFCASDDDFYPWQTVDVYMKVVVQNQSHDWPVLNPSHVVETLNDYL